MRIVETDVQRIKGLADLERPDAVLETAHVGAAERCEVQQGRRVEFLVGERGLAMAVVVFALVSAMVVMLAFLTVRVVFGGARPLYFYFCLCFGLDHHLTVTTSVRFRVPVAAFSVLVVVAVLVLATFPTAFFVEFGLDGDHLGRATRHLNRVQDRGIIATTDVRAEADLEQTTKAFSAGRDDARNPKRQGRWDLYLDAVIQHQPDPRHAAAQIKVARRTMCHPRTAFGDELHFLFRQPYAMSEDRVLAQQTKVVVYRRVGLSAETSHRVRHFPTVFGDVGLDGDVGQGCGEFAEFGEKFVTAGQGETGCDDWVDERFVRW